MFEALNGASTPRLLTKFINDVAVDDLMVNSNTSKKYTKYHFDQIKITGDLMLNPNKIHTPDLNRLEEESVKMNGTFQVTGDSNFEDILKIDQLEIKKLNGVDVASNSIFRSGELTCTK